MIYIPVDNVQANYLLKPSMVSKSLKSSLMQIAMVSSKGMLNFCYLNFLGVKVNKVSQNMVSTEQRKTWVYHSQSNGKERIRASKNH